MNLSPFKVAKSVLFILVSGVSINAAQSGNLQMYLCIDSMSAIKTGKQEANPVKLVYGYINGKKTQCMPENEFRARYGKKQVPTIPQPDSQKLSEKKDLGANNVQQIPEKKDPGTSKVKTGLLEQIYKGKRDLAGMKLCSFDLAGLDLSGADLRGADLNSADLRNAKLCKANLSDANLTSAYLKNADLRKANLENASLKGCYLQQANLTETEGLSLVDLKTAASLYKTILDPDVASAIKSDCPGKLKNPTWGWVTSDSLADTSLVIPSDTADRKTFH